MKNRLRELRAVEKLQSKMLNQPLLQIKFMKSNSKYILRIAVALTGYALGLLAFTCFYREHLPYRYWLVLLLVLPLIYMTTAIIRRVSEMDEMWRKIVSEALAFQQLPRGSPALVTCSCVIWRTRISCAMGVLYYVGLLRDRVVLFMAGINEKSSARTARGQRWSQAELATNSASRARPSTPLKRRSMIPACHWPSKWRACQAVHRKHFLRGLGEDE